MSNRSNSPLLAAAEELDKVSAFHAQLAVKVVPAPAPQAPVRMTVPRVKKQKAAKFVPPVEMVVEAFVIDVKLSVVRIGRKARWSADLLRLADQVVDTLAGDTESALPGDYKKRKPLMKVIQEAYVHAIGTAEREGRAVPDNHMMGQRTDWFKSRDREVNRRQLAASLADRMPDHLKALAATG